MGMLGGKAAKETSKNKAYGWSLQNYGPWATPASGAMNAMAGILGLPGTQLYGVDPKYDGIPGYGEHGGNETPPWATGGAAGGGMGGGSALGGLQQYFNSSGGQFLLNQGLDGLTSKFSAMGLSKSGAAMKAMEQFRQDLVSTKLDNYLGKLGEVAKLGLGAGGLVTGAGQYGKSTGATQGAGAMIGPIISAVAASSRDLKDDIVVLGPWDDRGDGLEKVSFRYKWEPKGTRHVGVIAEQVKELRPWAFVPDFYMGKPGVNYAALSAFEKEAA